MNIEKLYPACKEYLWGGTKLKEKYGKHTDLTTCAETWELSLHPDGQTRLLDGRMLGEALTARELGENAAAFERFPMLIKFIDAKRDLSVQVHPSDLYALARENSLGKTETWYIVEAEEGAGIYLGFRRDVTADECARAIAENTLTELLRFYPVKAGECYFVPAGTIHAIGAGCLICEIQQNSNLTYRVYDYGRRDKSGKPRELHIDKALAVTHFGKHERRVLPAGTLGMSRYFHAEKITVSGAHTLCASGKSFHCITCTDGAGRIGELDVARGDSFFVPADFGAYTLKGNMTVIKTDVRKYYLGIDLGGTFIKGGIVDDAGNILLRDKVPTEREQGAKVVIRSIVTLCRSLLERAGLSTSDVEGIGMGVPGMIDSERGEVIYSNNLDWSELPIADAVSLELGLPVRIANDANVAALGEAKFGCGKGYRHSVMLTLGTGVGSGIVIDGKLFEGNRGAGAELGHTVVVAGGEACTCGRRGCLEAYASATALIRDTKRAMQADPSSRMWEIGSLDAVTGKTAFDYYGTDESARAVVDRYIEMLGAGITNIANAFRPEAVILGGGVCHEGEALTQPLCELLARELFAGEKGPQVALRVAALGNDAGLLGAAALLM